MKETALVRILGVVLGTHGVVGAKPAQVERGPEVTVDLATRLDQAAQRPNAATRVRASVAMLCWAAMDLRQFRACGTTTRLGSAP